MWFCTQKIPVIDIIYWNFVKFLVWAILSCNKVLMSKLSRASLKKQVRHETGAFANIFWSGCSHRSFQVDQKLEKCWKGVPIKITTIQSILMIHSVMMPRSLSQSSERGPAAPTWTHHSCNLFSTCPGSSTCTIPS